MVRVVRAHPGAALRLCQPSSGFSVDRVPRPYFVPQPFLDCLPFRVFPSQKSWSLFKATSSHAVIHHSSERTASDLITRGFTDSHACTQLPGSHSNYEFPFHESEDPLPGRPGSPPEGSSLPPAFPASKHSSFYESVRTGSSKPEP